LHQLGTATAVRVLRWPDVLFAPLQENVAESQKLWEKLALKERRWSILA